jgi:hypothetical protein
MTTDINATIRKLRSLSSNAFHLGGHSPTDAEYEEKVAKSEREIADDIRALAASAGDAPNLACKSVQKRLATQWGYVPAPQVAADKQINELIDERDRLHATADQLANAIAEHLDVDIGEHSSANCPWAQALNALNALDAAPQVAAAPAGWRDGVEAVAKLLRKKADDYAEMFGHDDMGSLSFGCGHGGEAKSDHHEHLLELEEEVRAMAGDCTRAAGHEGPCAAAPEVAAPAEQYTHWKAGGTYTKIGEGSMQSDIPLPDMSRVVIYQGDDGKLWVRCFHEFRGRFNLIETDADRAAQAACDTGRAS